MLRNRILLVDLVNVEDGHGPYSTRRPILQATCLSGHILHDPDACIRPLRRPGGPS